MAGLVGVGGLLLVLVASLYVMPYLGPWPAEPIDPVEFGFRLIAHVLWAAATLLALSRAPTVRLGWLLLALTAADAIWALQFIPLPTLYFLADAYRGLPSIILGHVLVAFPSGSVRTRFDRRLVTGLYLYFVVGGVIRLLVMEPAFVCAPDEYCPRNPFALLADEDVASAFDRASALIVPLLGALVLIGIVRHWRAAGPAGRRVLRPVVLAFPAVLTYNVAWYVSQSFGLTTIFDILQLPVVNATSWILPGAFLVGVARGRSIRASLPGAVVELGTLPTTTDLEAVLRRRLGDPALRVVRWSRAQAAYLDSDGQPVEPPGPEAPRRLVVLERDGAPVAGVILDAALDDPALATTLTSLIRLTVDATDLRDELRAHGGDTAGLPSGEVTFLFGDVEGSTALLETLGERYADLLAELRRVVGDVVGRHGGRVVDARADEVFAAFDRAPGAMGAAFELQRRLGETAWPGGIEVKMRIGLHTGRPDLTSSGYVGLDVHRAARVMAAANGGQIVATMAIVDDLVGATGVAIRPLGRFSLRGLSEPVSLVQLDAPDRPTDFPPLRADPAH